MDAPPFFMVRLLRARSVLAVAMRVAALMGFVCGMALLLSAGGRGVHGDRIARGEGFVERFVERVFLRGLRGFRLGCAHGGLRGDMRHAQNNAKPRS